MSGRRFAVRELRRVVPWIALAAVVIVMIGPVLRGRDSYPASTYPMFSYDRGRSSHVATVVGVTPDGSVERLSPEVIAQSDEPMLAVQTSSNAVNAGGERSNQLCEQVARRVADSGRDLVTIQVVVEGHDAVDYFATKSREPRSFTVHAECEVPR